MREDWRHGNDDISVGDVPQGPAARGPAARVLCAAQRNAAPRPQLLAPGGPASGAGRGGFVGQPRPADPASPPGSLLPRRAGPRRRHVRLVRSLGARSQRPALGRQRLLQPPEPALQRGRPEGLRGQRVSLPEGRLGCSSPGAPPTRGLERGPRAWMGAGEPGRGPRPKSKNGRGRAGDRAGVDTHSPRVKSWSLHALRLQGARPCPGPSPTLASA